MKVGVLALQGAFREHESYIQKLGIESLQVRKKEQLDQIHGLIIPGGESTTIGKLLVDFGIMESLKSKIKNGMPVFGTCAGLIVLAKEIVNSKQASLGVMDITVQRNAFGRQVDSFEAPLEVKGFNAPYPGVFIRAPYIESVSSNVEILSEFNGKVVFAKQDNILVSSFHPELTDDMRVHEYFLDMIKA